MRRAGPYFAYIAIILFAAVNNPRGASAQMFQCPAGSVQNSTGSYSFDCRCPDGSLAGLYSGCPQSAGPPVPPPSICPAGYSYCGVSNMCCGAGNYCSKYGCTPIGAVDCGTGFCNQGQACTRDGHCMPAGNTECGNHSCSSGYFCGSRDNCMANGVVDCGNGASCPAGNKCSRDGTHCISQDTVDCSSHFCSPGQKCGSNNSCLMQDAVDCGGGRSCPTGKVCVNGGAECLTPAALAERAAAQKQAAQEKAELQRRLKLLPSQQKKEDAEATTWLKSEQVRLAKDAEARKATTAQAAQQQHIAQSMSPSQFDQKWCSSATLMTYGAFSSSEITNQRRVCATQNLSEMPAIKGNCVRAEMMAGCGCYTVGQVQAEAAALGCSGFSTAGLTLLPSIGPPPGSSSPAAPPHGSSSPAGPVLNPNLADIAHLQPPANGSSGNGSGQSNRTTAPTQIVPAPAFTSLSAPAQTPNLWDKITSANEKMLTSGPGQIGTETLQSAGAAYAEAYTPTAIAHLGDAKDLLAAAAAVKRGDYLAAAESSANYSAVTSAGLIGAALMPENPTLGNSIGQGSMQVVISTWRVYAAPAVADWLVQQYPGKFIPAAPPVFR